MRSPLVLALVLALTTPAHAAAPAATLAGIPSGAHVRLSLAGRPGTLNGSFVQAGPESLLVRLRDGQVLGTPIAAVGSLSFVDVELPSARKANLLGIGLGAAAGAVVGVVAGQVNHDGGASGGGGGGGGGDHEPRVSTAAAAPAPTQPTTSAEYRAVLGAIVGGLAGGVLGAFTGLGMKEAHWATVTLPSSASSWTPAPAATPVFAVRFALPHRGRH